MVPMKRISYHRKDMITAMEKDLLVYNSFSKETLHISDWLRKYKDKIDGLERLKDGNFRVSFKNNGTWVLLGPVRCEWLREHDINFKTLMVMETLKKF